MIRTTRRAFMVSAASVIALPLTGCIFAAAPLTFDLGAAREGHIRRKTGRTVVITLPKTVATYDTQNVVVRQPGNILSYLPDAQLAGTLPSLIQTRLLQSFEQSGVRNIGLPDDQLNVDVTLATAILAFEINVTSGSVASVSIIAKLVDERRSEIFATKTFSAEVPASTSPATAAIAGLDTALKDVMRQIIKWTAQNA